MCGFLGLFGGFGCSPNDPQQLARIESVLHHRGPDDFQTMHDARMRLTFWRLSIVDRAHGQQPMTSADGQTIILYNGEVYNYRKIRAELTATGTSFRTECDTEVILEAYRKWGNACFSRFEGMFAVMIIDKNNRTIVLARDSLGVKPLYFYSTPDSFAVASEPKALFESLDIAPQLDRTSLMHYLLFQTIIGTRTLFHNISKVPPGFTVVFDMDKLNVLAAEPIYRSSALSEFLDYPSCLQAVRGVINESVQLATDTDLPLCFHLSGGLDSNLLLSLCRHFAPDREITCVTSLVDGDADPEWPFIAAAACHHRAHLERVDITEKSFFDTLDDVLFYLDEPTGDPGVIPQFLVNQSVLPYSKIVFSGQGLDEMFFGYTRNLASYLLSQHGPDALNSSHAKFQTLPKTTQDFFAGWDDFLKPYASRPPMDPTFAAFRKLCRFDPFRPGPFGREVTDQLRDLALDVYTQLQRESPTLNHFLIHAETQIQLPALLHMEDRASMRHSIETRVPFCTKTVLDLAFRMDAKWKLKSGKPKGILRDAFGELLPKIIHQRNQKVGRPIPLKRWLNGKHGRPYREELLAQRNLFQDLFGMDFVEYALNTSQPFDRSTWAALSLSRWIDRYHVKI